MWFANLPTCYCMMAEDGHCRNTSGFKKQAPFVYRIFGLSLCLTEHSHKCCVTKRYILMFLKNIHYTRPPAQKPIKG